MDFIQILLCTLCAYLIGSIPSAIWISKLFYGIEIRDHGNGTATHNNMLHIMGMRPSVVARIIDTIKGFFAAHLALIIHTQYGVFAEYEYSILLLAMGLAAVLGHIFPIFASFKGGKGYHVSLGVFLSLYPMAAACSVAIALVIFWLSRYPNLGHIVGGLALPVFIICSRHLYGDLIIPMMIFSLTLFLLLFISHKDLMLNLLYGNEVKVESRKSGGLVNW